MSILKSQLNKGLKEIYVQFCQISRHVMVGGKEYVVKNYTFIKQMNPELLIPIREASGAEARVFARFVVEKCIERKVNLQNANSQDIEKALEQLVKSV